MSSLFDRARNTLTEFKGKIESRLQSGSGRPREGSLAPREPPNVAGSGAASSGGLSASGSGSGSSAFGPFVGNNNNNNSAQAQVAAAGPGSGAGNAGVNPGVSNNLTSTSAPTGSSSTNRRSKRVLPILAEFEEEGLALTPRSPTDARGSSSNGGEGASSRGVSPVPHDASFASLGSRAATPSRAPSSARGTPSKCGSSLVVSPRHAALVDILSEEAVSLAKLKEATWRGCPDHLRSECWGLLAGYVPPAHGAREQLLARKRAEYAGYRRRYDDVPWDALLAATLGPTTAEASAAAAGGSNGVGGADAPTNGASASRMTTPLGSTSFVSASVGEDDVEIMKQIRKDVPRTGAGRSVLQAPIVQTLLTRVLFVWAIRHPACGYVQGMNDLVLPFLMVQLVDRLCPGSHRVSTLLGFKENEAHEALASVSPTAWANLEADVYWTMSRLLNNLQDNYTFNQAGCHSMVKKLEDVMRIVDPALHRHLESLGIAFIEFAFRWMNCLLLRELSATQALRLFDTYLSEVDGVASFHVYVCCALLSRWSNYLQEVKDMGRVMQFLQVPPTFTFTNRDIDELTSSAYLMQQLYDKAPRHLNPNGAARGPQNFP